MKISMYYHTLKEFRKILIFSDISVSQFIQGVPYDNVNTPSGDWPAYD